MQAAGNADIQRLIGQAMRRANLDRLTGKLVIEFPHRDGDLQGRPKFTFEGLMDFDASAGATLKK